MVETHFSGFHYSRLRNWRFLVVLSFKWSNKLIEMVVQLHFWIRFSSFERSKNDSACEITNLRV